MNEYKKKNMLFWASYACIECLRMHLIIAINNKNYNFNVN